MTTQYAHNAAADASFTAVPPTIRVGGRALAEEIRQALATVVVDSHLHLPDMFELTFAAPPGEVVREARLAVGAAVTISATAVGGTGHELISGEVTSIEASFAATCRTVVRGYTADHRLQRGRRTRTFLNSKVSDVARRIADEAGLGIGEIQQTRTACEHIGQVNQTDWEFLTGQASAVGCVIGMTGGRFHFRRIDATGSAPVTLTYPDNLQVFLPRLTAGNLVAEAEVRVWDPMSATVRSGQHPVQSSAVRSTATPPATPAGLAGTVARPPTRPRPVHAGAPGTGPEPSTHAFVVSDRPVATGAAAGIALREAAEGLAEQVGSTFAEAEGEAIGDSRLTAGAAVRIAGVSEMFTGTWVLTRAQHVFDELGYHTRFEVSGSQQRTLLHLASAAARPAPAMSGLVCGLVTNVADPLHKGRVKVCLPWLAPSYESDWAPVAQVGAGEHGGALFVPDIGDEVLVGFEFGDPRRAYVLGSLVNNRSNYRLGGDAVRTVGQTASVVRRGFAAASGTMLAFHDEQQPPVSQVVLGTQDTTMALTIDQQQKSVQLVCSKQAGSITVQCGPSGDISITAGAGGTVTVDGGAQLNLKAAAGIKVESQGVVEIKGAQIKLN